MDRPCPWCEEEFQQDLGERRTGKSHGICFRHLEAQFKKFGKSPSERAKSESSFDLSTLSPNERHLLGLLYAVVKNRQTAKGRFNYKF
jgi:hypothetical protein